MGLGFLTPSVLMLMAAAIFLGRRTRKILRAREAILQKLGTAHNYSRARIVAPAALVAVFTLAIARPWWGKHESLVPAAGRDIVAVVDVSNSMLARDAAPSRLDVAKRKLTDLVRLLETKGSIDRVAIVAFGAEAILFCPPTADYSVLPSFIQSLSPDIAPLGGSSVKNGIKKAHDALVQGHAIHPAVLLLTDGGNFEDQIESSAALLKDLEAALLIIGIGSEQGTTIQLPNGRTIQDKAGAAVVTSLNEAALQKLAEQSSGVYTRAKADDSELRRFLLLGNEGSGVQRILQYHEIGAQLCLCILLTLLLLSILGKRAWIFPVWVGVLLTTPRVSIAQNAPLSELLFLSPRTAAKAYERQRYEEAERAFGLLIAIDPKNPALIQGLASSKLHLGKVAEAEALFEQEFQNAKHDDERFVALYNLGTTQIASAHYAQAIRSLSAALLIDPSNYPARHNLALARRLATEDPTSEGDSQNEDQQNSSRGSSAEQDGNDQAISSFPEGPILLGSRAKTSEGKGDTW